MDADVIVIGAGAAGLQAARGLADRALRVIVLEGRERAGGRAWSRAPLEGMPPAEMGAEFIHGKAHETHALLREMGVSALEVGDEGWRCTLGGDLKHPKRDFFATARIFAHARGLQHDESVDDFLRRCEARGTPPATAAEARAFVEGFDAADPAVASAQAIADELGSGTDSASARPPGTYTPLVEHVRAACVNAGVHFECSTIVKTIAHDGAGVTVRAIARGAERALRARGAIVSVPAALLRALDGPARIRFEPDLPLKKREALGYIETGNVAKVALWFRSRFWETVREGRYRNASLFRCPGDPFPTFWTQAPARSPLIVAWAGGPNADRLLAQSGEALVEVALEGFGRMLGEPGLARREFAGGAYHDWAADPFALGAYSYIAVGGMHARAALAAPAPPLFFAGEATSTDGEGGTVNGALRTGERAAAEAAAALEAKPGKHR